MTTTLEMVRAKLTADAGVTALVAARIYPQVAPQDAAHPLMVLTVVSDAPLNAVAGSAATRLREARVQVDIYAKTYLGAHEVADAAELALADLEGPALSAYLEVERDLYDDEAQLHRVWQDYLVAVG